MERKQIGSLNQLAAIMNRLLLSVVIAMICHDELNGKLSPPSTTRRNCSSSRILVAGLAATSNPQCLPKCVCEDMMANCSNALFRTLPSTLNPALEVLDLSDNLIKTFGPRTGELVFYRRLKQLYLSRNEITSLADNAFQGQGKLEILNLEGNRISSLSPNSLNGLGSLRVLDFNNNALRAVDVDALRSLTSLEVLDLTGNEISDLSETTFSRLHGLRHLSLKRNKLGTRVDSESPELSALMQIHGLPTADHKEQVYLLLKLPFLVSSELSNLTKLDLSYNTIQIVARRWSPFAQRAGHNGQVPATGPPYYVLPQSSVSEDSPNPFIWYKLEELALHNCFIEFIEADSFEGLMSLLILKLHDNSLTEMPSSVWKDLPNLEVLQIGGNRFTTIDESAFNELRNLRELDVSSCPSLESIKPGAFKGNINLERLDLSSNPSLGSLAADAFEDLDKLKYLFLRGNNLTTIDERLLLPMGHRLELLDVRENALVCDCTIEPLRQILLSVRNRSRSRPDDPGPSSGGTTISDNVPFWDMPNFSLQAKSSFPTPTPESSSGHGSVDESKVIIENSQSEPKSSGASSSSSHFATEAFEAATFVYCSQPDSLAGQQLIKLDPEELGCYDMEWLTILIVLMVVIVIIVMIAVACCCVKRHRSRFRTRRWKNQSQKSAYNYSRGPSVVAATNGPGSRLDRQQKLFHLNQHPANKSPIYDLDYSSKPDFIVGSAEPQKIDINFPTSRGSLSVANEYYEENEDEESEVRRVLQPPLPLPRRNIPSTDL